jgi:hypothetical protein
MNYTLVVSSKNIKTGPIPVSMTSAESCPKSCPFNGKGNGCYSATGPIAWVWNKLTNGKIGVDFKTFLSGISSIPEGQIWRLNQSGDLPGKSNRINGRQLSQLTKANSGKKGFAYTHKPVTGNSFVARQNRKHIKTANKNGFTINLSANNLREVDRLIKLKIGPVVTVLPENSPKTIFTKDGNKVIVCPAQTSDKNVTCSSCQLCQKSNRSVTIGFRAHGVAKKKVNLIAQY